MKTEMDRVDDLDPEAAAAKAELEHLEKSFAAGGGATAFSPGGGRGRFDSFASGGSAGGSIASAGGASSPGGAAGNAPNDAAALRAESLKALESGKAMKRFEELKKR